MKRVAPCKTEEIDENIDYKKKIRRIVELVYMSGFLKNEKPLSLLLLAPPEQSKTHFLLEKTTKFCHYSTDLSFIGLVKVLKENKNIKHIVIPDFLKITQKKQSTKNNLLTLLNAFLEEGIFEINLGNSEKIDLKGRKGGIITATTDYSFRQNKKSWEGIGFSSRFIVVSWKYGQKSLNEIFELINNEVKERRRSKTISMKMANVESSPEVNKLVNELSEGSPRRLKNFQLLIKTIAMSHGRNTTTADDVKELNDLSEMMNFRFKKI